MLPQGTWCDGSGQRDDERGDPWAPRHHRSRCDGSGQVVRSSGAGGAMQSGQCLRSARRELPARGHEPPPQSVESPGFSPARVPVSCFLSPSGEVAPGAPLADRLEKVARDCRLEDRDGRGSIDAKQAAQIAICDRPPSPWAFPAASRLQRAGSTCRLGWPRRAVARARAKAIDAPCAGWGGAGPIMDPAPHYRAARPVTAPAGRPFAVPMGSRSPCPPTRKAPIDPSAALRA
jgi:hypothetical protein